MGSFGKATGKQDAQLEHQLSPLNHSTCWRLRSNFHWMWFFTAGSNDHNYEVSNRPKLHFYVSGVSYNERTRENTFKING